EQARLHQPDVILLDIQMPGMNGLVCAEQLSQLNPRPAIVFCTAYDQHALEAFKAQAQAYLLKPIDAVELEQALSQLTQLTQAQLNALPNSELLQDLKTQRHQIAAKTYRGVELIPVENIYYFLADQKYVTVRHKNGSVLIDETLKELETEFADQFIRIHRNALVSVAYLDGLELVSSGQYQVRLRGLDERLSVSRRHLSTLRERIHQL
ncbi:DNA-binding response regulator, partial [Acinetobacter baumannii]